MDGGAWWAAVHGVAKSQTRLSDFTFTFHFHALEKEMATHSSILAWRIPGMGEPGGLPSLGLHRVGHDWSDLAAAAAGFSNKQDILIAIHKYSTVSSKSPKPPEYEHFDTINLCNFRSSFYTLVTHLLEELRLYVGQWDIMDKTQTLATCRPGSKF